MTKQFSFACKYVLMLIALFIVNTATSVFAQVETPTASASFVDPGETVSQAALPENPETTTMPRAIQFGFAYRGEAFTNLRGGFAEHRGALLGSIEMSVGINIAQLGVGRGELHISGQNIHGNGINDRAVGAIQAPSNLDSPGFSRLIEAWYSDSYLHDMLRIKIGRQYGDTEFQGADNAANFLNSSYGLIPNIPMPTYPSPELGASVWVSPVKRISFGAGVYRGQMLDPLNEADSSVRKGVFTVAETKIGPFAGTSPRAGMVRVGVWHQNGGAWLASGADAAESKLVHNYGVYASADYYFRKGSDENCGPGMFAQWGWAPADRNEIHQYWGTGVSMPSIIKGRQQDAMGVGVNQARLSATGVESSIETFYKIHVTKRFMLQPDLQWVNKPSGTGRNALVGGVRVAFEL